MNTLETGSKPPVIICAFDRSLMADYFKMATEIRAAGLRAEVFIGAGNVTKQMKYVDRRGAQLAVLMGEDELSAGQVTVKDMHLGAEMAKAIESNEEWKSSRPAQETISRDNLVSYLQSAQKDG